MIFKIRKGAMPIQRKLKNKKYEMTAKKNDKHSRL